MQYSQYLQTNHWQNTRQIKLAHRSQCQVCKTTKQLHIHHKHYENILFKEKNSNLITLCASCHRLMHRYLFGHKKLNKMILRVKRLMELGAKKNKAFWVVNLEGDLFNIVKTAESNQHGAVYKT